MKKQTTTKLLAAALLGATAFCLASCSLLMGTDDAPSYGYNGGSTSHSGNINSSNNGSSVVSPEEPNFDELTPSEGLEYTLSGDGTSYYIVTGTGVCTDTDIVVPSTYEGLPVTGIGSRAFKDYTALTDIIMPDSITEIGAYAFSGCTGLQSVWMGNSVAAIYASAFANCTQLTSINIPDSITEIDSGAFTSCRKLAYNKYENGNYLGNKNNPYVVLLSVDSKMLPTYKIHESAKIIYSSVFMECKNLVAITIPDSVTNIGDYAFYKCERLASVTFGNSVTTIGDSAFYYCTGLTSIDLPDSVTNIGDSAFYYCIELANIDWGNEVQSIGESSFQGCRSLETIVLPNSIQRVGSYAFNYCSSLKSVVISNPNATVKAGFYECPIETATILADMIPSIANENLKSLKVIGEGSISGNVFYSCVNLTDITISDSITLVESHAFNTCTNLINITVDDNNKNYKSLDGNLYTKDGTTLVQYAIGKTDAAFKLPTYVTTIGNEAFYNCLNLKSVDISDSTISIGDNAFAGSRNLESVIIGKSVKVIGAEAFRWCENLTNFTFNGTVAEWGAIAKGIYWRNMNNYYYIPATEVVCSDGTITL